MSIEAFLISMQAAGAITDIYATNQMKRMGRAGTDVELFQLNTRLEEERTAASMRSLDALKQLRMTLATQRATFAARGQRGGSGSAFTIGNTSIGEFQNDERIRRINLISREGTLRAAGVLTGMHQLSSETKLGQSLSQRLWDQIPFSEFGKMYDESAKKGTNKIANALSGPRKAVEGV